MKIIFIIIVIIYFFPLSTKAELRCQWTTFSNGKSCDQALNLSNDWRTNKWSSYDDKYCSTPRKISSNKTQTTVCCCQPSTNKEPIKPKYIIITILTVIFASITGYVIFIRK